ncbi:hypothetical protein GCK72_001322 [Caenorhabditis remanei]|uniref:Uncharacterized protein n=1 Tax=Caenorhabditis remanei TaxID=31234 RepID=A0A6A5HPE4_CAERE|nr:hypothetical protein GCK72_001322 [Caenorhabditis remanei]KAF1769505.1 hypothetical protein GCK72_001322 [Caenorhabditis remanei]
MIDAYKDEDLKRKEMELNLKRQELEYPYKKKKSSSKSRQIHIITKPCTHVDQNNSREIIVRQVNEDQNDEVRCSPPLQPPIQQQQMVQMPPQNILNLQQDQVEFQTQYVLVPVEMMRKKKKGRKARSSGFIDPMILNPQRLEVEDVSTQTSDRSSTNGSGTDKESEDWLSGFDESDGEKKVVNVERVGDKNQNNKRQYQRKLTQNQRNHRQHPEVFSDGTRVSTENPPSPPKNDLAPPEFSAPDATPSVPTPNSPTTSDSSVSPATGFKDSEQEIQKADGSENISKDVVQSNASGKSSSPKRSSPPLDSTTPVPLNQPSSFDSKNQNGSDGSASPDPKGGIPSDSGKDSSPKKKLDDKGNDEKSHLTSQYFGRPGESTNTFSSNNYKPPLKSSAPAARASIFPYFIDPNAPSSSVSTSKASSKLTNPELEVTDSSCALYRQKKKKMPDDSAKIYTATSKTKSEK